MLESWRWMVVSIRGAVLADERWVSVSTGVWEGGL